MLVLVIGACQDTWKEWRNKGSLCNPWNSPLVRTLRTVVVLHLTSALLDTDSSSRSYGLQASIFTLRSPTGHWYAQHHPCFYCSYFYWLLSTLLLSEAWFLMPFPDFYRHVALPVVFILVSLYFWFCNPLQSLCALHSNNFIQLLPIVIFFHESQACF